MCILGNIYWTGKVKLKIWSSYNENLLNGHLSNATNP